MLRPPMLRLLLRGLGAALAILVLVAGLTVAGALGWRAWERHRTAETVALKGPDAIDEAGFVRIGGIDQWVTIRGQDRRAPVLLILHGGPGIPLSYLARTFLPMERRFVVVQWDQRGGGRTLVRDGGRVDPNTDMARMVADGVDLSQFLRAHLHRDRIVLVGHSFGAVLGAQMARARPDLYAAYVGTGVVSRTQGEWQAWLYTELAARMTAAGDASGLAELRNGAGPPPWPDDSPRLAPLTHAAQRYLPAGGLDHWAHLRAVLTAPHWTLADALAEPRGEAGMLHAALWKPGVRDRYLADIDTLAVPVIVIQGADDLTSPTVFVRRWLGRLKAPAKTLVVIPGQGHEVLPDDMPDFTNALEGALKGRLRRSLPQTPSPDPPQIAIARATPHG